MENIKPDSNKTEEFRKLLAKDWSTRKFKENEITTGIVTEIGKKFIFVDLGAKSEGQIPVEEIKLCKEFDNIKKGSKI